MAELQRFEAWIEEHEPPLSYIWRVRLKKWKPTELVDFFDLDFNARGAKTWRFLRTS